MALMALDGNTLGEKHKYFNKLVQEAVGNKSHNLTKPDKDESDIHNLLQIDTACKTRNVDYIIEVLKCDDMLYVSRAIKHSTWLITEQEYAQIINPEYLYTQLFPHMLTKAINKLLLHIRLHLKDEKRVEEFYDYFKNLSDDDDSHKWLQHCSIPFILNVIQNQRCIPLQTFKRLCKRSVVFLQYYTRVEERKDHRILESVLFLIKTHSKEYLNMLETAENDLLPNFTKKSTEIVMKKYPQYILNNLERYVNKIHLPILAKYINKENIRDFLLQHSKTEIISQYLQDYENLNSFIKRIPEDQRYEFIKETHLLEGRRPNELEGALYCYIKPYNWYQYAPFHLAFTDLKKMVSAESTPAERCAILSVLITCAKNNPHYTKIILRYYQEKHRNEPYKFRIQFVNNVITQMPTHEFDKKTWNILDKLLQSLNVYTKSDSNLQLCLEAIITYKILHDENIPESVEKKISFQTFEIFQGKLNKDQKNKVFDYLINGLTLKMQNIDIQNETEFIEIIDVLKNFLNLLNTWNIDITMYVSVFKKFKELIKLKKHDSWQTELSSLYNINRSWRRYMFEESVILYPSEEVCLNVLKHDPQLLTHHNNEMNALRRNDTVSLRRLLAKIRVYWPESLTHQWIDAYLNDVNNIIRHKVILENLFVLLSQKQVIDYAKKYIPTVTKIDWNELDEIEFKFRKNIAGSLYKTRPQIPLEMVLLYAKGDYLQYALPSLNALLYNMSQVQSQENISKMLEASVSLQKYGIHLAFMKLKFNISKPILLQIWNTTINSSIKTTIFTQTYDQLCKVKDELIARDLWHLLSMFFNEMHLEENGVIFSKLHKVKDVHVSVQGDFFMNSYAFLTSLPAKLHYESHIRKLIAYAPNIMDLLDEDFVVDKILRPVENTVAILKYSFIEIISSFVLHGKTENEQCERSRKSLVPALEYAFLMNYNIDPILNALINDFVRFTFAKRTVIPIKLFTQIKSLLDDKMCVHDNYVQYTHWKLITEYVKLVEEHKSMLCDLKLDKRSVLKFRCGWMPDEAEDIWKAMHTAISPKMGQIILKQLKEDTEKYFPTICWLFTEALQALFYSLTFRDVTMKMEILPYILDKDFIPSYLVVCKFQGDYEESTYRSVGIEKRREIRKLLLAHPSKEVQMHYFRALGRRPD